MAIFNPDPQPVQIPDFQSSSKGISQPAANTSLGTLFKGVGDIFEEGVKGADSLIKEIGSTIIANKVLPVQDEYVAAISKANETIKDSGGQTLISADTSATVPKDINSAIRQAETLHSAKANGALTETAYLGKLYAILKDTRSQFPGYTDYIDKKMSSLTGRDVANDYLKSMITDINSFSTNARAEKEKVLNKWLDAADKGVPGAQQGYAATRSGQWSQDQSVGVLQKIMERDYAEKVSKQDFENRNRNRTIVAEDVKDLANEVGRNIKLADFEMSSVGTTNMSLSQLRSAVSNADPTQAQALGQQIALSEANFRSEYAKKLNEVKVKSLDPSGNPIERSYAQTLGPSGVKELVDFHAQDFGELKTLAYSKEFGSVHAGTNAVSAINSKNMIDTYKGKSGYYFQQSALYKALGTPETEKLLVDHFLSSGLADELKTTINMKRMEAANNAVKPDGNVSTLKNSVDDLQKFKGIDPNSAATSYNQLIGIVNDISNPAYTEAQRVNMVKWAFSPQNLGLISKFEREGEATRAAAFGDNPSMREQLRGVQRGQYSIYSGMTSDAILKSVKELSDKGHPELWEMTKDWARQSFGRELYFGELQNFNKLQEGYGGLRGNISWDNENHMFLSLDKTPFVQNTLQKINQGLATISNIAKIDGSDVNSYMLGTLQELRALSPNDMIQGLPQAMYDAVRRQKEAQKQYEEESRQKFKKDQDKVKNYGGSR